MVKADSGSRDVLHQSEAVSISTGLKTGLNIDRTQFYIFCRCLRVAGTQELPLLTTAVRCCWQGWINNMYAGCSLFARCWTQRLPTTQQQQQQQQPIGTSQPLWNQTSSWCMTSPLCLHSIELPLHLLPFSTSPEADHDLYFASEESCVL